MPTKVRLAKAMVFPVVMYGYESWTVKKAEHRRIDAFERFFSPKLLKKCETAKETQMYRTVFWTLWERERVG